MSKITYFQSSNCDNFLMIWFAQILCSHFLDSCLNTTYMYQAMMCIEKKNAINVLTKVRFHRSNDIDRYDFDAQRCSTISILLRFVVCPKMSMDDQNKCFYVHINGDSWSWWRWAWNWHEWLLWEQMLSTILWKFCGIERWWYYCVRENILSVLEYCCASCIASLGCLTHLRKGIDLVTRFHGYSSYKSFQLLPIWDTTTCECIFSWRRNASASVDVSVEFCETRWNCCGFN